MLYSKNTIITVIIIDGMSSLLVVPMTLLITSPFSEAVCSVTVSVEKVVMPEAAIMEKVKKIKGSISPSHLLCFFDKNICKAIIPTIITKKKMITLKVLCILTSIPMLEHH